MFLRPLQSYDNPSNPRRYPNQLGLEDDNYNYVDKYFSESSAQDHLHLPKLEYENKILESTISDKKFIDNFEEGGIVKNVPWDRSIMNKSKELSGNLNYLGIMDDFKEPVISGVYAKEDLYGIEISPPQKIPHRAKKYPGLYVPALDVTEVIERDKREREYVSQFTNFHGNKPIRSQGANHMMPLFNEKEYNSPHF